MAQQALPFFYSKPHLIYYTTIILYVPNVTYHSFRLISVGESSGKAARGLVSRTHGTGGIQSLQAQSQAAVGGEVSRARLVSSGQDLV
ncbi:hypothetical protein DPMN_054389 [Dreissena polymorpha]|uniref:Uncharacterized protein n=1 Tax=Dreissena polymorpha TaxID=45954 RepID=A0A9D4CN17_DREPO|nr:hypothetical protein DPMN_054389 [Dreissena polymorpha]